MIAFGPPLLRRPLEVTPHGHFGEPRPKRNGIHFGNDFRAAEGDQVISSTAGTVARLGFDKPVLEGGGGGGNFVIVQTHGSSPDGSGQGIYEIGYMHLSSIQVSKGQAVDVGSAIGLAGSSGAEESGSHLHYQINYIGDDGGPKGKHFIDPSTVVSGLKIAAAGAGGIVVAGALALAGYAIWKWRHK